MYVGPIQNIIFYCFPLSINRGELSSPYVAVTSGDLQQNTHRNSCGGKVLLKALGMDHTEAEFIHWTSAVTVSGQFVVLCGYRKFPFAKTPSQ